MSGRRSRAAAVLLVSALVCSTAAQEKKNLTPGEVVLLSNAADPATADEPLKQALLSSDPAVRMTAARVVAVVPHGALRGALIAALAREQDPKAAAELVRDLLLLSGAADIGLVNAQLKRFGADAAVPLADWLARIQPQEFASRLSDLATASGARTREISTAVRVGAAQHPSNADAIYRAWIAVAPPAGWDSVMSSAFAVDGIPAGFVPLVSDALDSSRPHISEETVWYVLRSVLRQRTVPREILSKASTPRAGVTPWDGFGRELLARGSSATNAVDRHELIAREGESHTWDLRLLSGAPQLTPEERDAVTALLPAPRSPSPPDKPPPSTAGDTPSGDGGATFSAIAPGVVGSTLSAAGCNASHAGRTSVAKITYGTAGHPVHIVVDPTGLTRECQAALTSLARTSLVRPDQTVVSDESQLMMLPFNSAFVACVDEPAASAAPARLTSSAHVDAPQKVKDVRPIYPEAAQRGRIEGVVILDATISPSGCVSEARVTRSIPFLDGPAVQAVTSWVFRPARVNGVAVPVYMTVTVNFALR